MGIYLGNSEITPRSIKEITATRNYRDILYLTELEAEELARRINEPNRIKEIIDEMIKEAYPETSYYQCLKELKSRITGGKDDNNS